MITLKKIISTIFCEKKSVIKRRKTKEFEKEKLFLPVFSKGKLWQKDKIY